MTERILFSSKGETPKSELDPRFGRAQAFLLKEGERWELHANEAREAAHGAGVAAVALVQRLGATQVVAGEFGPKVKRALGQLGVQMWQAPEGLSVEDTDAKRAAGQLPQVKL